MGQFPITTNQELASNRIAVAPQPRVCKNLVNGLASSCHSLGASINGETPPVRVRTRGGIDPLTARAWVHLLPISLSTHGEDLALETWIQYNDGKL